MNKSSFALICLFSVVYKSQAQSYVPKWNDDKIKIKYTSQIKAYAFQPNEVSLLKSPFEKAREADAAYLLKVEPDRLLSNFREHAGLKPKAKIYGGWESEGLAGHTLGHYLSACAMQYAYTGNKLYLDRVNYIVSELDQCQKARKTGYMGAIPKEDSVWTEVSKGNIRTGGFDLNGAWAPWYTVHKVMAGLLDAYLYCDNQNALAIQLRFANWAGETIKNLDDRQIQKMLICEYGGMAETLVNTYALTGDKKYLTLSYKFYDRKVLDPLSENKDILPGRHSNTQIPKIIAGIRRFELTGDKNDRQIADFFWKTVTEKHSYVTGGNSNYEYLTEPGKLTEKLTDNTTETCNTYNMLKLTGHLFTLAPSATLMDYYERGLYNHILASQNHEDGMMCYFVPLRMGGQKHFSSPYHDFTCCVGSGMENHVKYNESIYMRGADGSLYVNLFIPSELNWKERNVCIRQETNLPSSDLVNFSLTVKKPVKFTFRFRKARWTQQVDVLVNGVAQDVVTDESGYLSINRIWKNNDKISISMPSTIYTESMPDNINRKAVFYGPVLLAGVLGNTEPDPVNGIPVFVTSEKDTNKWLEDTNKDSLLFRTVNLAKPQEIEMMPFNQIQNQYYSVYLDVFTPDTWAAQQKIYEQERKRALDLQKRTIDILRLGEMQPERDHDFKGEKATNGEDHQRKWRSTEVDGSLSFDLATDEKVVNSIMLTFWGMDNRGRIFDLLIDGVIIATEDINKYKESRFYDINFAIPKQLTAGKQKVRITLKAKSGNTAGPIYGVRMLRGL